MLEFPFSHFSLKLIYIDIFPLFGDGLGERSLSERKSRRGRDYVTSGSDFITRLSNSALPSGSRKANGKVEEK